MYKKLFLNVALVIASGVVAWLTKEGIKQELIEDEEKEKEKEKAESV